MTTRLVRPRDRSCARLGALALGASIFLATEVLGQAGPERRNAIYVELLGSAVAYSVNYERTLLGSWYLRIGGGYFALQELDSEEVDGLGLFPMMIGYVTPTTPHKLELAVGVAPVVTRGDWDDILVLDSHTRVVGTGTVGYRFAPTESGFLLRVALTPLFGDEGILPWGGVSLGYRF
jgi:hypothetical protein